MKSIFQTLPLFAALLLSSCGLLDHRDYYDQMDARFDEPMFEPFEDFEVIPGDQGRFSDRQELMKRVPATASMRESDRYRRSITRELRALEARVGDDEYQRYASIKERLGSDHERIYYLRLSPYEKERYLRARGFEPKRYARPSAGARYPAGGDIVLGMQKSEVLNYWGEPDRRDYAGNPRLGNERWAYRKNGQTKYIFFESGRVEGWTNQ